MSEDKEMGAGSLVGGVVLGAAGAKAVPQWFSGGKLKPEGLSKIADELKKAEEKLAAGADAEKEALGKAVEKIKAVSEKAKGLSTEYQEAKGFSGFFKKPWVAFKSAGTGGKIATVILGIGVPAYIGAKIMQRDKDQGFADRISAEQSTGAAPTR